MRYLEKIHGKRYLILRQPQKGQYKIDLAYWFEERKEEDWTYKEGFYYSQYYLYPRQNVISYVEISEYTTWGKNEKPVYGEWYLVYRIGTSWRDKTPHYAIRKFNSKGFRNDDVKYWIRLSVLSKRFGWNKYTEKRKPDMNRKCTSLKRGESVVFNTYSDILKRKYTETGTVLEVYKDRVVVSYLLGYKDTHESIPFEDMLAAFNPNGEWMKFESISGKSDLLIPE